MDYLVPVDSGKTDANPNGGSIHFMLGTMQTGAVEGFFEVKNLYRVSGYFWIGK